MSTAFIILLIAAGTGWAQADSDACCKCGRGTAAGQAICLSTKEMRGQVSHFEPLQTSGLGKGLNLAGTVVLEIRFGPDGKVACSHVASGHPIAISAAMESLPKWTFKPVMAGAMPKGGCGHITIKYKLRDQGSSTELQ